MNLLTKHLRDVNETYFQHFRHAMYFAARLMLAAIACAIHGIFPFLFERTGSKRVAQLHADMVENRVNFSTPNETKEADAISLNKVHLRHQ